MPTLFRHAKRDTLILFGALILANASNYGFHLVMTRLLGAADYGGLSALLGMLMVLAVPVGAVQAIVAGRIAEQGQGSAGVVLRPALRSVGSIAGRAAIAAAVLSPVLATLLHLPWTATVLFAAMIPPAFLAPAARGALQGSRRFASLGLGIGASTIARLALGAAFAALGMGVTGAMLATLVAEVVGLACAVAPMRSSLKAARIAEPPVGEPLRGAVSAGNALLALWLLVTIDVVLARHYLPAREAGIYAAAALLGRAVLFLPGAAAVVLLPSFVETRDTQRGRLLLLASAAGAVACGVVACLAVALVPELIGALFGAHYGSSRNVAGLLAIGMGAFGAVTIVLYHGIALGRRHSSKLWTALVMEVAAIAVLHDDPRAIATVVLFTGLALCVSLLPSALRVRRGPRLPAGELYRPENTDVDLSVVMPTYNGERIIGPVATNLVETLREAGIRYELIVVSDGSTDETPSAARAVADDRVRVLHYEQNSGKGYALRTGLARATGRMIAFIDADGDLDPISLVRFYSLMDMYDADMVIGSKRHPLSDVTYPLPRRVMSWTYHKLVRVLFGLRVQDTQTGVKLIRRSVLADVLPRLQEKRFAFDLELLAAARRAGYRRILEAPVVLNFRFESTISWRSVTGILRDTAGIWVRCYVLGCYDVARHAIGFPSAHAGPHVPDPIGARA